MPATKAMPLNDLGFTHSLKKLITKKADHRNLTELSYKRLEIFTLAEEFPFGFLSIINILNKFSEMQIAAPQNFTYSLLWQKAN